MARQKRVSDHIVNYVRNAEKNEAAAESTGCSLADMMLMIATMVAAAGFGTRNRKNMAAVIAGAMMAVIAAVVFILTQDMAGMMKMFDRWTILMGVLFTAGTMMMAGASRKAETR